MAVYKITQGRSVLVWVEPGCPISAAQLEHNDDVLDVILSYDLDLDTEQITGKEIFKEECDFILESDGTLRLGEFWEE